MGKIYPDSKMLSVIFVAFGGRLPLVKRLINSLSSYSNEFLEIISVDNNSNPNISEWLMKNFPSVITFRNKENIGTARAYNIRINLSKGRYLMLINDDCYLKNRVAEKAVDFLESHPEFMGLGFSLLNPDGTAQFMKSHIYFLLPFNPEKSQIINFLGTNNLLCRREAFKIIGLFDENYFFFNEDLDWSWRAWRTGIKFYYKSELKIYHSYGFFKKPSLRLEESLVKDIADLYFYWKNMNFLFKFIKVFYKMRLRHNLNKANKIELYSQLRKLLNIEKPEILNNLYNIQKMLMNSSVTNLLQNLKFMR